MRPTLFFFLILLPAWLPAQTLTTVSTKWNDSFVEWEIFALLPKDTSSATEQPKKKMGKKQKKAGKNGLTKPKKEAGPAEEPPKPQPVSAPRDSSAAAPDEENPEPPAAPQEELYGEFKLRWLNVREDWTEWDFELGGERGTIRAKWKDDPSQWELRTYTGAIVTMRTAWPNDNTQWRVTDNSVTLLLKSRWTNQLDEWLVQDATRGKFYLYTLNRQDPRDWAIEDGLDATVSDAMKLAMVFLTVFQSTPRQ
jgi:glucan-binding YG repeat protein